MDFSVKQSEGLIKIWRKFTIVSALSVIMLQKSAYISASYAYQLILGDTSRQITFKIPNKHYRQDLKRNEAQK